MVKTMYDQVKKNEYKNNNGFGNKSSLNMIQPKLRIGKDSYSTQKEVEHMLSSHEDIGWDDRWGTFVSYLIKSNMDFSFDDSYQFSRELEYLEGESVKGYLKLHHIDWQPRWDSALSMLMKNLKEWNQLDDEKDIVNFLETYSEPEIEHQDPEVAVDAYREKRLLISLIASEKTLADKKLRQLLSAMLGKSAFVSTSLLNTPESKGSMYFYQGRSLGFLVDGRPVDTYGNILGIGSSDLNIEEKYKRVDPTPELRDVIREKYLKKGKTLNKLQLEMRGKKEGDFDYNEVYVELVPDGIVGLVYVSGDRKGLKEKRQALIPMQKTFQEMTKKVLPLYIFDRHGKELIEL